MKLKSSVVRAVLESQNTDLPRATVIQISEMARTLIHEELVRLDAKRHPESKYTATRREDTLHHAEVVDSYCLQRGRLSFSRSEESRPFAALRVTV